MLRDLTMIISVLVSVASLGFGVYKNIEANNAKGFAYQQAYRILNIVQKADITAFQRATIADAALVALGTPPPVIDLSRSSADTGGDTSACSVAQRDRCMTLASDLATANAACTRNDANACTRADTFHSTIIQQACINCFTQ